VALPISLISTGDSPSLSRYQQLGAWDLAGESPGITVPGDRAATASRGKPSSAQSTPRSRRSIF